MLCFISDEKNIKLSTYQRGACANVPEGLPLVWVCLFMYLLCARGRGGVS